MLTDEERQEWARREWERGQADTKSYWQSMWERSMHNPKNKRPMPPEYYENPEAWVEAHAPEPVEMPGDLPYPVNPRNTWTPPPKWEGVRGTPNAPCCKNETFSDKDLSILTEAHGLVYGPRQRSYGHPAVDFARTAALVNTLLAAKLSVDLGPEDVALFMVAVKLSREVNEHGRDNLVDAAGYLECRERVLRFLKNTDPSKTL